MIRQSGQWPTFQRWKRELLAAGPYWDFSGYNALALSPELFRDVMHFKPAVGQQLLRRLLNLNTSGCDSKTRIVTEAGTRVDDRTICDLLAAQEARMRTVTTHETDFARAAAQALAARGFSPAALMAKSEALRAKDPIPGRCRSGVSAR
jgi:hypothetical protein